jgi:hypothetical protein
MDDDAGREVPADDRILVRDSPRKRRGNAPVAVAGDVTADPPDRLSDRETRSAAIHERDQAHVVAPRENRRSENAADEPAVPDEAGAGEDLAQRVSQQRGGVVQQGEHAGADEPREKDPYEQVPHRLGIAASALVLGDGGSESAK